MKSASTDSTRILSIDLLRGLAVLLMLFVTDAAGIVTTPKWLLPSSGRSDSLTLADLCLPWFLLVCGAAIPVAFRQGAVKYPNKWLFAFHILMRTLSLWIMGIMLANADDFGGNWRSGLWSCIMLSSFIVGWMEWPKGMRVSAVSQSLIRVTAMIILALLAAYYGSRNGEWLTIRGWGTLGLIGWGYLLGSICFLVTRGYLAGLVFGAAILFAMHKMDLVAWQERLAARSELELFQPYLGGIASWLVRVDRVVDFGSVISPLGGCVLLGCILGTIAQDAKYATFGEMLKKIGLLLVGSVLAAVIYDAGSGVSSASRTPAWILYSVLVPILLWFILWFVADRGRKLFGIQWLADIGANSLFAFLLVPWLLALLQLMDSDLYQRLGAESFWNPLWRPCLVTIVVGGLTAILSRIGWRMTL